ncbi:hypothetical protein QW46_26240 [Salmonella enterica]|nr:hypothetical protein [Salmonella enterica]
MRIFYKIGSSGTQFRKEKNGLAARGIVTAHAVTLFTSSLRCGASGALRLPCPIQGMYKGAFLPPKPPKTSSNLADSSTTNETRSIRRRSWPEHTFPNL